MTLRDARTKVGDCARSLNEAEGRLDVARREVTEAAKKVAEAEALVERRREAFRTALDAYNAESLIFEET